MYFSVYLWVIPSMYVYCMCALWNKKLEDGIRFSGAEVTGCCQPSCERGELDLGPLQKQAHLSAVSSLQPRLVFSDTVRAPCLICSFVFIIFRFIFFHIYGCISALLACLCVISILGAWREQQIPGLELLLVVGHHVGLWLKLESSAKGQVSYGFFGKSVLTLGQTCEGIFSWGGFRWRDVLLKQACESARDEEVFANDLLVLVLLALRCWAPFVMTP